tara:strand:- start:2276 stop:3094 length:819 start_codon:yes stop_codon:yes gene_type:complete
MSITFGLDNIINKQLNSLLLTQQFLKTKDINDPKIGSEIWKILTHNNENKNLIHNIDNLSVNRSWAITLALKLQRIIVDYQLHQLKLGNTLYTFEILKDVFTLFFFFAEDPHLSVLDIGCGSGYYCDILQHFFPNLYKYHGCDTQPEIIQIAKEYYPFIDFRVQDLTNMKYNDKEFDISIFSHGSTNMFKYNEVFEEACRITKKYIILHRICVTNEHACSKRSLHYYLPSISHSFNNKTIFDIFEKHNFTLIWEGRCESNAMTFVLKRQENE